MNAIHICMKNWSDYPIFLAVAETGSLTAAGKKLHMSQPTVGRRIKALEDAFGTAMLRKEGGKLVPTVFGHSVLDHIRRMDEEAAAIARSSASLEQSLAGPVRISATEGLGTHWLPPVMQTFRQAHPDLLVELSVDFREFNLAQREADIALRWMGPGTQNSLIGRKVLEAGFGVYASRDYIDRAQCVIRDHRDLQNYDSVIFHIGDDIEDYVWPKDDDDMLHPMGRVTFKSNSLLAHTHALVSGYGIGIMPVGFVKPEMNLVNLMPDDIHYEALWIVAHEDLTKSIRIRAVFDYLVDALSKDKGFFIGNHPSIFEAGQTQVCCESTASETGHKHVLTLPTQSFLGE